MRYNFVFLVLFGCTQKTTINKSITSKSEQNVTVAQWTTFADQSALLKKTTGLPLSSSNNTNPTITIDSTKTYQTMDGFGYTLTGGSAELIMKLPKVTRTKLIIELFGNEDNSINISYLRLSIGASDLDSKVFSYNDLENETTDLTLSKFSLNPDRAYLIPMLKEILKLNPKIKLMATPWSPPVWMKSNRNSKGGSLLPKYYEVYAQYLVKYLKEMAKESITIDAVTLQNEPLNGDNNPSMIMTALEQSNFIKNSFGPALMANTLKTKIIIWDHNADNPQYPISILDDTETRKYVDGSAFHLYNGNIDALSAVKKVHPDKNLYFTEQWTGSKGSFGGDLGWHIKNVIIGSMQNWSRNALEWNLANDINYGPHTPGGCTECKGALTINGETVERNVSYYIIAHASKFVLPGSIRIESNIISGFQNVAFVRVDGKKVLIVQNGSSDNSNFNIKIGEKLVEANLPKGGVATFVW